MLTLDLKGDPGIMLFDAATAKIDFETGEQKIDYKTGLPQWTISALVRQKGSTRAETINITLNSAKDPSKSFEFGDRIIAKDLTCIVGASQNGGNWLLFVTESIEVADKTAKK